MHTAVPLALPHKINNNKSARAKFFFRNDNVLESATIIHTRNNFTG